MPPRKRTETSPLGQESAKIGEPVPTGIIDTNTASVGIPPGSDFDAEEELGALRKQLEGLREQVTEALQAAKGSARQAARQTEATVRLYPVSSLVAVAVVTAALSFAIGGARVVPQRSRYERALDDIRELFEELRERLWRQPGRT
ncbi:MULTISPECIES: hypothetical protein [unclassified Rhizobium]|uniref:hypothetical protein n=1 Tax=unclassified Rhizobium TaxID=2613769 RepID=UPI00216927FA|nr:MULTISPECIES: hypothetical protein [unclassified Rhizobium]MCS3741614.1 hypothetical protein [Rhizobium sp. BK661]MCS4093663.1 hypothetical protein [Rhizobium sp. BK176]